MVLSHFTYPLPPWKRYVTFEQPHTFVFEFSLQFIGSDHRDAFTLAFKLLWGQVDIPSRECEPIILFLTDGEDSDPVFCRPASYFGTEEGALFVPGPNCVYDFNEVITELYML